VGGVDPPMGTEIVLTGEQVQSRRCKLIFSYEGIREPPVTPPVPLYLFPSAFYHYNTAICPLHRSLNLRQNTYRNPLNPSKPRLLSFSTHAIQSEFESLISGSLQALNDDNERVVSRSGAKSLTIFQVLWSVVVM
jgi:hypothetical protein